MLPLFFVFAEKIQSNILSSNHEFANIASSDNGCTAFSLHNDSSWLQEHHPAKHAIDQNLNTGWYPRFLDDTASSDDIPHLDRLPTLVLLFRSMHLVSVLQLVSGLGTFPPVTRTSIYFSTSNADDILAAIPAHAAAAAGINPPPQLNPVPVWRPLLGLHVLSEDAAVDGHTVLTRSGSAVIALPGPGSLVRALKLVVEDAAGSGGGGGVPVAALQEIYALAPAAHNPQVPARPCAPLPDRTAPGAGETLLRVLHTIVDHHLCPLHSSLNGIFLAFCEINPLFSSRDSRASSVSPMPLRLPPGTYASVQARPRAAASAASVKVRGWRGELSPVAGPRGEQEPRDG